MGTLIPVQVGIETPTLYILGDVFLRNVLAAFDWGGEEMQFAAREYHES